MKYIFELLKLFEGFRKLLNEHFESERKELQEQVESWKRQRDLATDALRTQRVRVDEAQRDIDRLSKESAARLNEIYERDAEIERLQNATTAKLKAVDTMPADDVFNAPVFQPRTTPRN